MCRFTQWWIKIHTQHKKWWVKIYSPRKIILLGFYSFQFTHWFPPAHLHPSCWFLSHTVIPFAFIHHLSHLLFYFSIIQDISPLYCIVSIFMILSQMKYKVWIGDKIHCLCLSDCGLFYLTSSLVLFSCKCPNFISH